MSIMQLDSKVEIINTNFTVLIVDVNLKQKVMYFIKIGTKKIAKQHFFKKIKVPFLKLGALFSKKAASRFLISGINLAEGRTIANYK